MIPTFADCEALKDYVNGRIREVYRAAGCPAGFEFDIETVRPADDDPFTAEIITRAGTETFATRLVIVGCLKCEGGMN